MKSTSKSSSRKSSSSTQANNVAAPATDVVATMSLDQIREMLETRTKEEVARAEARVTDLRTQLATAEAELSKLSPQSQPVKRGPRKGKGGRKAAASASGNGGAATKRIRNAEPLSQVLHQMFKGKADFSVRDATEALEKSDFKSNAKNKYVLVYTALKTHEEMFKKVDRGVFKAI